MNLKDILAISGKGGLFKFISQGRSGVIVESFDDKKRSVVHGSSKVSALEDIAIFTETEEIPLGEIFNKISEKENGKKTIDHKSSSDDLKALMKSILPEYDKERVYVSDMKKLIMWYNMLQRLDLLKPDEESKDKEVKKGDKKIAGTKVKSKTITQQKGNSFGKAKPTGGGKSVTTNIPRQKSK